MGASSELSSDAFKYAVHHVFLPPRLPQSADFNSSHERELLDVVLAAMERFKTFKPSALNLQRAIDMTRAMVNCRAGDSLDPKEVRNAMETLSEGGYIAFELRHQNFGVLIHRGHDVVRFEQFELLARNEAVMACKGRLIRKYPGSCVELEYVQFNKPSFQTALADALAELDRHTHQSCRPKIRKDGKEHNEERDTINPKLLFLLNGVLRGLGRQGCSKQITKHSREEVLWHDAHSSWHRSASWMFLRISLQLVLDRGCEAVQECLYKDFMAFLMSELLRQGLSMHVANHLLYCMAAKVNRRFLKLSPTLNRTPDWFTGSFDIVKKVLLELEGKWNFIQKENSRVINRELEALKTLRFQADTALSLGRFQPYLDRRLESSHNLDREGSPSSENWLDFTREEPGQLPRLGDLETRDAHEQCYVLVDYEHWVAENLEGWLETHITRDDVCNDLMTSLEAYYKIAHGVYQNNPVNLSVMWITIMELWIACDKSVVRMHPLLKDHPTGFPEGLLKPLLMTTKSQLRRLQKVENYLTTRNDEAKKGFPTALEDFGQENSLAARFYARSEQHQRLHEQINASAERDRAAKAEEFKSKKQAYSELQRRFNNARHKELELDAWTTVCEPDCHKCAIKKEMEGMRIAIHEWPLPSIELHAKVVVFELQVPDAISTWRRVTMDLLNDMLQEPKDKASVTQRASERLYWALQYPGLVHFASKHATSPRLQLASVIKPLINSHYSHPLVSEADMEDVCQNYAGQYDYFDWEHKCTLSEHPKKPIIPQEYSFLHLSNFAIPQWIGGYSHSSNQVIARQDSCPNEWSLDEFKGFGHLRSGVRLQWRNIVTQLMIPSVDFNKVDTAYLIMQAIYEAGPARDNKDSIHRDAHGLLQDQSFGMTAVEALRTTLVRVEENWECDIVLLSLTTICTRLLSLSTSRNVHEQCFDFLARVRAISRRWVNELSDQRAKSSSVSERNDLDIRILGMALICARTFDVEPTQFQHLLSVEGADTCFIETSIIINNHSPKRAVLPPLMAISLQMWRRLSYHLTPTLSENIANSRCVLDKAIKTFWAAYTPEAPWTSFGHEDRYVFKTQSAGTSKRRGLPVSLDLLDGSLLVDGQPLSHLPRDFQDHPTYLRLFGTQILEIVPSELASMKFSTARPQWGWIVHFAMVDGNLNIQACKDGSIWEFIPPSEILGDFPTSFINPYSHWLDLTNDKMEFRSFDKPWSSQGKIWRMTRQKGQWFVGEGTQLLIDPRSDTANAIAGIFGPIEDASHINLILDQVTQRLEVRLPRYDLVFTLEANDCILRSKHYPGMCIDSTQASGTLVGLESQLVLRPEDPESNTMRAVLVPHGPVKSTRRGQDHPKTMIYHSTDIPSKDPGYPVDNPRRRHHCFRIDDTLGRLVEKGSLQSKLLLSHLHAATSHCLPDTLTGRTGTEEALWILKSASVVSFERLENEEVRMLTEIASLSPRRAFYPPHLEHMQDVEWSESLDPLAQNDEFSKVVLSILDHAANCEMFFPDDAKIISKPKDTSAHLQDRALIRCSAFRVPGFGAEHHTTSFDMEYGGRDTSNDLIMGLEQLVCRITKILFTEQQIIPEAVSSSLIDQLYDVMGERVEGPVLQSPTEPYRFKPQWLDRLPECIGRKWCQVEKDLCHINLSESKYDLMTFFGALVFAEDANVQIIQILLAFTTVPSIRRFDQPDYPEFILSEGHSLRRDTLRACMDLHLRDISCTPEWSLQKNMYESYRSFSQRRYSAWSSKTRDAISNVLSKLGQQWPIARPYTPSVDGFDKEYFNVTSAMKETRKYYKMWERNLQLFHHIRRIVAVMNGLEIDHDHIPKYIVIDGQTDPPTTCPGPAFIPIAQLFAHEPPRISCETHRPFDDCYKDDAISTGKRDQGPLAHLISSLRTRARRVHERDYVDELESSFRSCQLKLDMPETVEFAHDESTLRLKLEDYVKQCGGQVRRFQDLILTSLRRTSYEYPLAALDFCYPRLTPIFVLQQLNRHNWVNRSVGWQRCLVEYGLALTHLQRSKRLLAAVGNTNLLLQEMKNVGHTWNPMSLPESLLLEVESGLMIREVQEKIAAQMRQPDQNLNSVMQLNMGEGKSSVIVQIVAASLANGNRLVRIIVAKPQSKQMRHMLVTKLGGLLDRQVFFMPFSRSIIMDTEKVGRISRTLTKCMKNGGVLLVQPEHLLSFKLMGIEYVGCSTTEQTEARNRYYYSTGIQLLETQKFLDHHSRDIIDESDENFSVKFELIYTIGAQERVDMSPDRWIIIQDVLSIVHQCAPDAQKMVDGIQLGSGEKGQFATLRILNEPAGDKLLQLVARTLCDMGVRGLPVAHQGPATRKAVLNFVLNEELTQDTSMLVYNREESFFSPKAMGILLLLRGLFAGGVLRFALSQKRWRVNYGLTERKPPTLLAVPYRAKDSPAPRAEFSHPDIVIILTYLSYYYGGLSSAQLFTAFEHLQRSDQADEEFANWVKGSTRLPSTLRQLSGVNLKDRSQFAEQIFPALKLTKAAIDFYLHKVVFPKEMGEFPKKLSASGWDLGKAKPHPVTGFSGTCDSKYVLPLEVRHLDLPDQIHTNAMVLDCLLRPENLVLELGPDLHSKSLLDSVVHSDPPIQAILDVGALIVELNNEQVARMWLDLTPADDKQAAIFFSDEDVPLVINRQGFIEPFLTSPFAGDTKDCLVFLDEAHTRGIDLKLPDDYRASVTLGPRLTKDRLVQGPDVPLTVAHVLLWSISETWIDTEKSIPLWAVQGFRHQRQEDIWNKRIADEPNLALDCHDLDGYFEEEAMSIEKRYHPRNQASSLDSISQTTGSIPDRQEQVDRIKQKCERFQIASFSAAALSEEQERELAPEIESERQTEKLNPMQPKGHSLHPDVLRLIQQGDLRLHGGGFLSAFSSFSRSTEGQLTDSKYFGQDLLVTTDFANTVELDLDSHSDSFHRPVQWVLTLGKQATTERSILVILSPWEANELILGIASNSNVHLHSYAARPNLSFPTLQDLRLCATPALPAHWMPPPTSLILQLNLFAGQLYFEDMKEYKEVCAFLGLSCVPNDGAFAVGADGFVGKGAMYPNCRFTQSPTEFLRMIMESRRNCQDISKTHVGRMLAGEVLTERDFHVNAG
ncbi:hypothetical protein SLS62_002724 [Diatrype stigma]|uniref:ubiquitinyl hydrolase 1 n=1 Tax=Diatrype stigma TaxID=117547 RepID=A0AAN9V613_9PEZI